MEREIEAILFYRNEPVATKEFSKILAKTEKEVREGVEILKKSLEGRGITLIEDGESISFATSPEVSELIQRIAKEEMNKDLGKAGLETLSIILYNHPISRREIDYVRGVNSNFILRSLLIRSLIEKVEESRGRGFLYKPTIELLAHLGIESVDKLPEYHTIKEQLHLIVAEKEVDTE